jgi:L-threonylcarbamoyladenylate synthase
LEPLRAGNGAADAAVAAIRGGKPIVIPTDTVYGLCANPYRAESVERAYKLKGRDAAQPSALLAADVDMLFECMPELRGRLGAMLRQLLPGPLTLVVPNPARRYQWLAGTNPEALGVRVPELPPASAEILSRVGALMATSANLAGGTDPRRVEDVPPEIVEGCAAVVDGGELPGRPSTVIDITGDEPKVLREGAVPAEEALGRVAGLAAE